MHASPSVWAHGHEAIWAFATVPASKKKKRKKKCDPWEGEGSRAPAWAEFPGTPTYTYVHLRTRTYTYVHVCTRTYTNVHICTRTYAHVHIRTRTYTHVHARTHTYVSLGILPSFGPLPPEGRSFFFFCWLAGWGSSLAWMAVMAGRPSLAMPLLSGVSIKLLY